MENTAAAENIPKRAPLAPGQAGDAHDGGPPVSARLLENTARGKELLIELRGEFERYCPHTGHAPCKACGEVGCRDKLTHLLVHFLNIFSEVTQNERKLIDRYRANPRYRKAMDEHLFAHDQVINDISAYVMDCDRAPIDTVVQAALSTLTYWMDGHIPTHDKLLLDIMKNAGVPST